MTGWWRFSVLGALTAGMILAFGTAPGVAQSRAHVYLLRGLMNIFSLGMDTLGEELERRGVYATVDNYASWPTLADQAAAKYKAGSEGPIILVGHSLGANAVMEMAAYLGKRGVPVALVVPFDGTGPYAASSNVARVLNLTQHYYMSPGSGFHGSLINVDLRADGNIDHLNIDKSPRLHARVIAEILGIVGARRPAEPKPPSAAAPTQAKGEDGKGEGGGEAAKAAPAAASADAAKAAPAAASGEAAKPQDAAAAKTGDGATTATAATAGSKSVVDGGTPVIALPEKSSTHAGNVPQ